MSKVRDFLQGKKQEPKWWLLTAGCDEVSGNMYSKSFRTKEQAEDFPTSLLHSSDCVIEGEMYNWYEVIDLRKWVYGEQE